MYVVVFLEVRKEVEHQWTVNTTAEALEFLRNHPEKMDDFRHWMHQLGHHSHNNEPQSTGHSVRSFSSLCINFRTYRNRFTLP